jgi:predicted transcriptional regulator
MMNYRDKLDITADILNVASATAKRTQIMYRANLSYKVLCRYLDEMLAAALLSCQNKELYVLTERGAAYLAAYKEYTRTSKAVEKRLNIVREKRKILEELYKGSITPSMQVDSLKTN